MDDAILTIEEAAQLFKDDGEAGLRVNQNTFSGADGASVPSVQHPQLSEAGSQV
jgi:hypothetical protein